MRFEREIESADAVQPRCLVPDKVVQRN